MSVAIVIPALNESPTIATVIARTRAVVPYATVVVVDDASSDDTGAIARACGAIVVSNPRPGGYANALREGYRVALAGGAFHLVQIDADGQHTPEDVPALLARLTDADLVIGSRFRGNGYRMAMPRRAAIGACSALARLGGVRVSDPTSGFRAMTSAVADAVATEGFPDGLTESSYLVWLRRRGFRIAEVPVTMTASPDAHMHSGPAAAAHFGRIVRSTVTLVIARSPR